MYLSQLHLQGFKSFADSTQLTLKPGITAIVGPNGCGKSNIADALRWVLGEQSAKSLRAEAMSDVIFQGSANRGPLGMCEVSLVFSDCEKTLGTSFNELEITRRVMRDGSGEYFINSRPARLKDIQLLFLGTGVGQISYSFLLQGRIDQILSSNPAERRAIFEEAAGVSRYKAQRRDALDKLRGVEADLARVGDVIAEIEKNIGSLKRQAAKALRHKALSERAAHLELALAAWKRICLSKEIAEASALLEGARTRMLVERGECDKLGAEIVNGREARNAADAALSSANENIFNLRSDRDKALAAAETAAVRMADTNARLESARAELAEMAAEKEKLDARDKNAREARKLRMEELGESDGELESHENTCAAAKKALDEAERLLAQNRQALARCESGLSARRNSVSRQGAEAGAYEGRAKALEDEIRLAARVLSDEKNALEAIKIERAASEKKLTECNTALNETTASLKDADRVLCELQDKIRAAEREIDADLAHERALSDLQNRLEGFSDGAKALVHGKIADAGKCRTVADIVDVDEKWAGAVELVLGQGADAAAIPVGADPAKIRAALAVMGIKGAHLILPPIAVVEMPLITGAITATDVVRAKDPCDNALVGALFAGCIFFETFEEFLKWRKENPACDFSFAATLDGCAIDSRGVAQVGKVIRDSPIARGNQIKKLLAAIEVKKSSLQELNFAAGKALEERKAIVAKDEDARRGANLAAQELAAIRGRERGSAESAARSSERLLAREKDRKKLDDAKAATQQALENEKKFLDTAEKQAEALRKTVAEVENSLTARRGEYDKLRGECEKARAELAGRKQRLEMAHREVADVERAAAEWIVRNRRRTSEASRDEEQIKALEAVVAECRGKTAKVEESLKDAHVLQEKRRDEAAACQRRAQDLDAQLAARRAASDALSGELSRREIDLAKLKTSLEGLADEVSRSHAAKLESIDWRREIFLSDEDGQAVKIDFDDDSLPDLSAPKKRDEPTNAELLAIAEPDWENLKMLAVEARRKIDALGAVNLLAIEEYRELRDRHSFLKAQSDDLWQSREKLYKSIDEINHTSAELFNSTFETIRKNFAETFKKLFGGGEANLELTASEDVLEAGVEITARPPGTKLRSIALLSGGQKTMTATALLFAIYMVKPSPFCVLDEIDAPLDEANVGRFSKMLDEFLEHSQFFIITHNKHTIAAASTIYGVTMEERGVSKVVSMHFEDATK
jgi:chromosome segregation protein